MDTYHYQVSGTNEKERWIFIFCDEQDCDEPDSFIFLMEKIRDDLHGKIIDKGNMRYSIDNDKLNLVFQWDGLFGITVVYPPNVEKGKVIEFLNNYF